MRKRISILLLLVFLLFNTGSVLAQDYYFAVPQETVQLFWNQDGTLSVDYLWVFTNTPSGHDIDFLDVGMPNTHFDINTVAAQVDDKQLTDISRSGYQGEGDAGFAVGLGSNAIGPGQTGRVHVFVGRVEQVLYNDSKDQKYASAVFIPSWFGSQYVTGTTDLTVTYHLPPGVKPEEPRWHSAPDAFPSQPETGIDENGRIIYTWRNPNATASDKYQFGASFPKSYVPAEAIVRPNPFAWLGTINFSNLIPCGCILFVAFIIISSAYGNNKRKLQYLPPKIAIEGHGIKRGLTAVEAATLMEQPVDKVLTMILFSVVKKGAATVTGRDPLKLEIHDPQPEGMYDYEKDFLEAYKTDQKDARRRALQTTMINLVKGVSAKMKGFSSRETVDYYRDIMKRAWAEVEASDTPEVKSQKFDEVMEWTMLDRQFEERTRDTFGRGPVFVPIWWGRYDPTFRPPTTTSIPTSSGGGRSSSPGGGMSMPTLPGGAFAASVVGGLQNFSSNVIGNLTDFTSGITRVTNPPPASTSSGTTRTGGGGSSCACACACACAGCACACAGGGR